MAKLKNKASLTDNQLTVFLPEKAELKQHVKFKDKTDEELDQIAEDYVKLAFVFFEITKQKAVQGVKK